MAPALARASFVAVVLMTLAGCTTNNPDDGHADEPHFTLTLDGPIQATAGEQTTFTLAIGGSDATSDHIGAHHWTNSTDDPNGDFGDASGCEHQASTLPGTFQVTCTFPREGPVHLRGHMRDADGKNWWTSEHVVNVVGL